MGANNHLLARIYVQITAYSYLRRYKQPFPFKTGPRTELKEERSVFLSSHDITSYNTHYHNESMYFQAFEAQQLISSMFEIFHTLKDTFISFS